MSTPVFVDPEISTQADGHHPLHYLISTPPTRHAEDSVDSDTSGTRSTPSNSTAPLSPDHPLTHASPTLVPILRRTACMAMRVSPVMSPGLTASIAEVVAMSDLAFLEDDDKEEDYEEEDKEEEDEEVEESSDSDNESEDAKDEGPTAGDEGLVAGDEGPGMRVESLSLGGEAAVPEGQQWAALVVETAVSGPLQLGYGALRRQEIALGEGRMPSVFEVDPEDGITYIDVPAYPPPSPPVQTPPSPEWSSGSLVVSPPPSIVPSPISSPVIPLTVPSPVASPATAETEGFLT
ncbi:hypothetical protein Tco_1066257 [Tanacetum coccineum]|uniref:Uncharacterized protein n=1 Tax=Tanacetum coccineum TaxID=301880 RepID=A0ABQ5HB55_9ASTR